MTNPRVALLLHLDSPPLLPDEERSAWWARTGARLLQAVRDGGVKVGLSLSGPVVDWLHLQREPPLAELREAVATGSVELVATPFYDPVLCSVPGSDGTDQILAHVTATRRLIDVRPTGCWLPRRVWDPEIPRLMRRADIAWTVVEDAAIHAHHVQQGIDPWGAWRTERGGHAITLLANDVGAGALRGTASPEEFELYLMGRASQGAESLCFAWSVRREGRDIDREVDWLVAILGSLDSERVVIPSQLAAELRGRVYLPSWAPAEVGFPWEQRLLRSPQADRLHKRMLRVSRLLTRLGKRIRRHDPDAPDPDRILQARRYLHRAQGGVHYELEGIRQPELRARAWHDLLRAEALAEEAAQIDRRLVAERVDLRTAGHDQVMLRTPAALVVIDPAVSGGITELCHLSSSLNLVDPPDREGGEEGAAFVDRLAEEGAAASQSYRVVSVERAADAAVRAVLTRTAQLASGDAVTVHKAFSLRIEPRLDVVFEVHTDGTAVESALDLQVPVVLATDDPLDVVVPGERLLLEEAEPWRRTNDVVVVGGAVDVRWSFRTPVDVSLVASARGATLRVRWPVSAAPEAPARLRLKMEVGSPGSLVTRVSAQPVADDEEPPVTDEAPLPSTVEASEEGGEADVPEGEPVEAPEVAAPELVDDEPLSGDDEDDEDDEARDPVPPAPLSGLVPLSMEEALGDTIVLQRNQPIEAPMAPAHVRDATPAPIPRRSRSLVRPQQTRSSFARPPLYFPEAQLQVEADDADPSLGEGEE